MQLPVPGSPASSPARSGRTAQQRDRTLPVISDYRLIRRIGAGAYGEVWLAQNTFDQFRAIKIVWRQDFDDDERPFQREFEGIRRFEPISRSHPSQLSILHVGRSQNAGCFYYVMELADPVPVAEEIKPAPDFHTIGLSARRPAPPPKIGDVTSSGYVPHTLRFELKARGRFTLGEVIDLGLSLTEALSHLHAQGLVHRDIKPSNVIFVNGKPKLADIGLVSELGDARSVVGTAGYLAPEGSGTAQADIYGLGKLLYEMATGCDRRDFPKLPQDWQSMPERPSLLELNEILLRACSPDARSRYHSVAEMRADLSLIRAGKSLIRREAWRRCLRIANRGFWILLIAAALARVWFWRASSHSERQWSLNVKANAAFKSGLFYYQQDAADSFEKAAQSFQEALDLDPAFARAWARLALTYVWLNATEARGLVKAREFANKALALDPQLDEAHHALAAVKTVLEHDWAGAEMEHLESIRLNPQSEDNYYGYAIFLAVLGRTNDALQIIDRASRLDSLSTVDQQEVAFVLTAARQYDRAIAVCTNIIAREEGSRERLTRLFLIPSYRGKGDYLAAIDLQEQLALLHKEDRQEAHLRAAALKDAFLRQGELGYWQQSLSWSLAHGAEPFDLAVQFAHVGNKLASLNHLNQALEKTPLSVAFYINREPAFDALRDDPAFVAALRKLGMRH